MTNKPTIRYPTRWHLKQSADASALDLYIYDDVEGSYYDWFGDFHESETSAGYIRRKLEERTDVREINIYINSMGGEVVEGTAIYNQLKRHSAYKTVYIDGFACSIASVIAMAGDKVVMPCNTLMFIHPMQTWVWGNSATLRKEADDLDVINVAGEQAYLQKANGKLDEETLSRMMGAETWLTAEQCLKYGLADVIPEKEADMDKAKALLDVENRSLEQHIERRRLLTALIGEADGKARDESHTLENSPPQKPDNNTPPTMAAKMMAAFIMRQNERSTNI